MLAVRLKQRRLERGWTQAELAWRTGMTVSMCRRLEKSGKVPAEGLCAALHALGCGDALSALAQPEGAVEAMIRQRGVRADAASPSGRVVEEEMRRPTQRHVDGTAPVPRREAKNPAAAAGSTNKGNFVNDKGNVASYRGAVAGTPPRREENRAADVERPAEPALALPTIDPATEAFTRQTFGPNLQDVIVDVMRNTLGRAEGLRRARAVILDFGLPARADTFLAIVGKDLQRYAQSTAGPVRISAQRFAEWRAAW